jgi:hypothetical protein
MDNATTVTIDRETYNRLKDLAGDSPMAKFLRELSINMTPDMLPISPLEVRLNRIEKKLDEIVYGVHPGEPGNSRGEPLIADIIIAQTLKENPEAKRAGWYDLKDDGKWYFDLEGFKESETKHRAEQDKLFARYAKEDAIKSKRSRNNA